jgi:hypothetical protein
MAQTTAFTYQGKLSDSGSPASGQYDLQFTLFDALGGGAQQGTTQTVANVAVSNGLFTVQLDFGACASCFDGTARFLEIAVKKTTDTTFTTLAPRQPISSTPYALRSLNATAADGLSVACINCITSSQIGSVNGSAINGTIPPASLPAGSGNYIQNQNTSAQSGTFNISGDGLIGGNVGIGTTTPQSKLEVQTAANTYGITYTDGTTRLNTYINSGLGGAGGIGTQSAHPLFFYAGNVAAMIIKPFGNVGIGTFDPQSSLHINGTSWFQGDTTPLAAAAGQGVGIGFPGNSNYGYISAYDYANNAPRNLALNWLGGNVGVGTRFPQARFHVVGTSWFQGDTTPLFLTAGPGVAIGYSASFDGGYIFANDYLASTGKNLVLNSTGGNVGIGTTTPQARLNIVGTSWFQGGTTQLPSAAGQGISIGYASNLNTGAIFAYDYTAATPKNLALNSTGGNVGIGTTAPAHRLSVSGGPTWTSSGWTGSMELDNASAIAWRTNSVGNRFGIGHTSGGLYFFTTASDPGTAANPSVYQMAILDSGNVGIGTGVPGRKLTVLTPTSTIGISHTDGTVEVGTFIGPGQGGVPNGAFGTITAHPLSLLAGGITDLILETTGFVKVEHISNAGTLALCLNASAEIATCSSSLRYKTNLAPYRGGLEIVNRLRPISFDWKTGGMHDVGFGAEEVEKISPLLVTYNQAGQVEGVKYDRLSVVFVNAMKEQQAMIGNQQQEIKNLKRQIVTQQSQLDALKQLLCLDHPGADVCK